MIIPTLKIILHFYNTISVHVHFILLCVYVICHYIIVIIATLFVKEMVYAWNGFQLLAKSKQLMESVLRIVWDELMTVEETRGKEEGEGGGGKGEEDIIKM